MSAARDPTRAGVLLHAKHAFMPNSLGYCGPDGRDTILRHLHEGTVTEELLSRLGAFEAAYPFIELIGRCAGREAYDPSVPEAYWIGNQLLDSVPSREFYTFSHSKLKGRDPLEVKAIFEKLGRMARPHHTFHVLSTFAAPSVVDGPSLENHSQRKIGELIDSCMISWAKVTAVGERELTVERRPLTVKAGRVSLGDPVGMEAAYDPEIHPFAGIERGDWVTMHWGFACDVLTPVQVRNIERFTLADIRSVNRLLET